jgi:hypothetical protein
MVFDKFQGGPPHPKPSWWWQLCESSPRRSHGRSSVNGGQWQRRVDDRSLSWWTTVDSSRYKVVSWFSIVSWVHKIIHVDFLLFHVPGFAGGSNIAWLFISLQMMYWCHLPPMSDSMWYGKLQLPAMSGSMWYGKLQLSRLWKGHDLIAAGGRLDLTNKWSSLISLNRCNKVLAAHLVKIYPYLVWILCQLFSCFNCLIGFYPSLLKVKFFSWTFFCI